MLHDQRGIASTSIRDNQLDQEDEEQEHIRDIHALTPPRHPYSHRTRRRRDHQTNWETSSHRSPSLSVASTSEGASSENFTTMSREFNALVLAGSTVGNHGSENDGLNHSHNLGRIGEEETSEETNPLAIVPDNSTIPLDPLPSPRHPINGGSSLSGNHSEVLSVQRVKKEEVETKINAWQTAKISKINNRFKREDAIINGWESEEIQKATSWMKKIERKLEEKRAKALEKMQNDIAKARRKAEERRASAEGKRGTKVARIMEIANLMRAVGRAPVKRSFF